MSYYTFKDMFDGSTLADRSVIEAWLDSEGLIFPLPEAMYFFLTDKTNTVEILEQELNAYLEENKYFLSNGKPYSGRIIWKQEDVGVGMTEHCGVKHNDVRFLTVSYTEANEELFDCHMESYCDD